MKNGLVSIWSWLKAAGTETILFLTSWMFFKNMVLLILALGLTGFLTFMWLHWYTNHGETYEVHDYVGMNVDEAIALAESRSFRIQIADSLFLVGTPPNTVVRQTPGALSSVKENRTIYLSVTKRLPEPRRLPDLRAGNDDFDRFRQKCQNLDVHVVKRGVEFNNILADNTILKVFYKGRDITTQLYAQEGAMVNQTDTIEVITSARSAGTIAVPDLICRRLDAARFLVNSYNLTVGIIYEDETVINRDRAFVYQQEPPYPSKADVGGMVNLYLTQDPPVFCQEADSPDQ
jgi:beta-lactam-binding protein with PASTA domain